MTELVAKIKLIANVLVTENMKWAIEFIRTVMKFIDDNEDFPWTTQEFINYRRLEDGYTALHLAILSGSIETVDCLIDLGADIFIKRYQTNKVFLCICFDSSQFRVLDKTNV